MKLNGSMEVSETWRRALIAGLAFTSERRVRDLLHNFDADGSARCASGSSAANPSLLDKHYSSPLALARHSTHQDLIDLLDQVL